VPSNKKFQKSDGSTVARLEKFDESDGSTVPSNKKFQKSDGSTVARLEKFEKSDGSPVLNDEFGVRGDCSTASGDEDIDFGPVRRCPTPKNSISGTAEASIGIPPPANS